MILTDIEKLAEEYLKIHKESDQEPYSIKRIHNDELHQYDKRVFDFRIEQEQFQSNHITFVVIDKNQHSIAGNMSLFLIEKDQFKELRFWKREIWRNKSTFKKITLADFPDIEQVKQIFMHGYIRSPSFIQKDKSSHTYATAVYRYVKFVIRISELCKQNTVPILFESMGKIILKDRILRSKLIETALTQEEHASIGITRPESLVTEKMARMLNIHAVDNIFNERTFGKVFLSDAVPLSCAG